MSLINRRFWKCRLVGVPTLGGLEVRWSGGKVSNTYPWSQVCLSSVAWWIVDDDNKLRTLERGWFCHEHASAIAGRAQKRWIKRAFKEKSISFTEKVGRGIPAFVLYAIGLGSILGWLIYVLYKIAAVPQAKWHAMTTKDTFILFVAGFAVWAFWASCGIAYLHVARMMQKTVKIGAIRFSGDRIILRRRDGIVEEFSWNDISRIRLNGLLNVKDGRLVSVTMMTSGPTSRLSNLLSEARDQFFPEQSVRTAQRMAGVPRRLMITASILAILAGFLFYYFPIPELDRRIAALLIPVVVLCIGAIGSIPFSTRANQISRKFRRRNRRIERKRNAKNQEIGRFLLPG